MSKIKSRAGSILIPISKTSLLIRTPSKNIAVVF